MTDSSSSAGNTGNTGYFGRTEGDGPARTPWRALLRTETGSAAVLLAGVVAALVWANIDLGSYDRFWRTRVGLSFGTHSLSLDVREWVNSGLMSVFFFVVGLEARRARDIGELRGGGALTLPVIVGISGMLVPVGVYLLVNSGHGTIHGWGAAMSTDTAFALGLLALLGGRLPTALRTFVLAVTVVDDFVALGVIVFAYSERVAPVALVVAVGILGVVVLLRSQGVRRGGWYALLATAAWVALWESGVDPVVVGLVMGLLASAYPAARGDLERATGLFRRFREQPTPELERSARIGLATALSPNDRLLRMYHPWSSYVIVPVFALANAGIRITADDLSRAFSSPVTLGIVCALVVGKPVAILSSAWLSTRLSHGRLRPPVGWGAVAAGGTVAGAGFTVSLLIATLAFRGEQLENAKIGTLTALLCASLVAWTVGTAIGLLPKRRRDRALLGTAGAVVDLAVPVDPGRDKVRGPLEAPVTVVEYGDFDCPYCGKAEPVIRELLADFGDVRYVWRHMPLTDVHPGAMLGAEASEAAHDQGAFWPMHDRLLAHEGTLRFADAVRLAAGIGLDTERFERSLRRRHGAERIAEDVDSADLSGVSGTPTFFVNGRRHQGAYDIGHLSAAVRTARRRAALTEPE
ncbi:Na+/H+ antiporter NhaA [Streptomyces sp. NBC_01498]|uniref:Na+/H+ antiporter NhaA n=1 Tax=Streptomyces sp. NBC_01498 TaxID=2975870 RepID=UPI002E7B08E1|nr:Na+/H+ antiporter NhaA [Streptomyces sp. NBC_01498]WTL28512.1 Na+/H+ antiporter NhaA [Streptomyces sp. NBC_01498]